MAHIASDSKPVNHVDPVDITDRRLLRIEDVAERLAVSRSMAWKLIAYGDLPAVEGELDEAHHQRAIVEHQGTQRPG
jgi:hypothetical protein